MPLLNRQGQPVDENAISNGAVDAGGLALVPHEHWQPDSGDGLLLDPDVEPAEDFAGAPLIAIDFPAFNDGRGLSLAVLLRTRYGFRGELRAVGDVHPDLLHYLKRCGFDTFLMPEGRHWPAAESTGAFEPYSDYYQGSVLEPEPAYRRVQRGV